MNSLADRVARSEILAMVGASHQVPNEGAFGVSMTSLGELSRRDLTLNLWETQQTQALQTPPDASRYSLDALKAESIGPRLAATVGTSDVLTDQPQTIEEIEDQRQTLVDACGAKPQASKALVAIGWIDSELQPLLDNVITQLRRLTADRPGAVADVVRQLRAQIERFQEVPYAPKSLARLNAQIRTLRELDLYRKELLEKHFHAFQRSLLEAAREQLVDFRRQALLTLASQRARVMLADFTETLGAFQVDAQAMLDHLRAVGDRLNTLAKQGLRSATTRPSGIAVALPEQDSQELLRRVARRFNKTSVAALATHAWSGFLDACATHAATRRPELGVDESQAMLEVTRLLPKIAAGTLAQMYIDMVTRLVHESDASRFWRVIEEVGPEVVANHLYAKATPPISANGRDVLEFGIQGREFLFASLPIATTPREQAVRQRVKEALESSVPFCQIGHASVRQDIIVLRMKVGIPAALWNDNPRLLGHYGMAEQHAPHLVGWLPGPRSADGQPCPVHLSLAGTGVGQGDDAPGDQVHENDDVVRTVGAFPSDLSPPHDRLEEHDDHPVAKDHPGDCHS